MQKRGLSDVVSTVLIILVVVAALAVIGVIVINVVNQTENPISSSNICNDLSVEPVKCSYNDTNIFGIFSVSLKNNVNISELSLVIEKSDNTLLSPVMSGDSLNNGETYSFLLYADNLAIFPKKLSSTIKVIDSKGNTKYCSSVNKVSCFPPLVVPGEVPAITNITANNSFITFLGNITFLNKTRYIIPGCTILGATNYNTSANLYDGSCIFPLSINWIDVSQTSNRVISSPGYYRLIGDINANSGENGITIQNDSVVFDGNGYTINGTSAGYSNGINIFNRKNITIYNLTIKNFYYGISSDQVSNSNFFNVKSSYNSRGIYVYQSYNNTLSSINVSSNTDSGILIDTSSNNTLSIINVLFNPSRGILITGNSNNNTLYNLNLTGNGLGISVQTSSNNTFNNIYSSFNNIGVSLVSSSYNKLNGTSLSNSLYNFQCLGSIYIDNGINFGPSGSQYRNQCYFL